MLPLLAVLLAPPLTVEAERLEVQGERVLLEGDLRLQAGGLQLRAPAAEAAPTAACPQGDLQVRGPLLLRTGRVEATAEGASACLPEGAVTARQLRLRAPRLRLSAAHATLAGGTVTAEGVDATACDCDDPPWRVTASGAEVTPGQGAWATWPVLWVGPVPIAAAPVWYVPLSRRRTGFLLPRLGWDGEDGPYGQVPFFWALHQSLDLTLAPGYRAARGAYGDAGLRWAATDLEGGALATRFIATEGATVGGDGTLPLGPARFAVEGTIATDRAAYLALHSGLAARRRDHLAGVVAASVAGPGAAAGVRVALLQDLRTATDLPLQPAIASPLPEAWISWTGDLGPGALRLDARYQRLQAEGVPTEDRLALDLAADVTAWLGPLRLRPVVGLSTVAYLDGEAPGQRLGAFAAGEAEIGVGRAYDAVHHGVYLIADGRYAVAATVDGEPPAQLPGDRLRASRAAGLTLSNRWVTASTTHRVDVRQGYEHAEPVEGFEAPVLRAVSRTAWFGLEGGAALPDGLWAVVEGGLPGGPWLAAGVTRLDLDAASPWLRTHGPAPARLLSTDIDGVTTVDGRLSVPIGPLALAYGAVVDTRAPALLGQEGSIAYAGGCDCWSARLAASHEHGRAAPDVWLTVSLTPE